MKKRKVFQFNLELFKVTGIQRVLLDIHAALKEDYECRIVGNIPYDQVNSNLGIAETDYIRLRNPLMFRNSVVIIHERRLLPVMWLLSHIPGLNIKCIYVHHSELYGNKKISLFPKNIVAISDAGIRNLTEYFDIPCKHITKIHNCVRETSAYIPKTKNFDPDNITILYPARINSVKRQIEIVNRLKAKLDNRVRILFAGTGPQYEELEEACKGNEQFKALGFRDDIPELMRLCDFMLLFSDHEGLPISLIEACKYGLPAICNNVGGNLEIVRDGVNGIVADSWEELLTVLNGLPDMSQSEYDRMSRGGREIYEKEYNFDIFKSNYLQLIKNIR